MARIFFYVQPLTGIHLYSNLKWELEPNSDRLYVYVFIVLFSLSLSQVLTMSIFRREDCVRAKEVGVRKVAGASVLDW